MLLRPISFSIPSTTELKITFSDTVSLSVNSLNFSIERLSGEGKDLSIENVSIDGKSIIIKTSAQSAGSYYALHLLSPEANPFISQSGDELINDDISRAIFFVGIVNVNPIRDFFLSSTPQIFETSNSVTSDVLSAQAEEFYTAQKKIGELLSNNYLSIDVKDEVRTRTAGPTDRLSNENAYEIYRVSSNTTNALLESKVISFSASEDWVGRASFPYYPISLQEEIIEEEQITLKSSGSSFEDLIFTLSKKNISKILAVTVIPNGATEDCKGEIGSAYDIEKYRYSILESKYDPEFAFSNKSLESNQFSLSYYSNLPVLGANDKILVRYAYRDFGQILSEDSLSIYSINEKINEPVPTNSSHFFLLNAPVVFSNGDVAKFEGVSFKIGENLSETPACFTKEVKYDLSRLPSSAGEYAINYETGEVFVYGTNSQKGTGRDNIFADYLYKRVYKEDIDYFKNENDIVAILNRDIIGSEVFVSLNYEPVFAEGVDYIAKSHIEVIEESVQNRLATSFGVKVKNAPITNVFSISNKTTGEIYNLLYHNIDTVYFYGNKAPKVASVESEGANFTKVTGEDLQVVGRFISPAFDIEITNNASRTNIIFEPAIPAELISYLSQDYVLRGSINEDDRRIIFFGTPDSNNLISSFAISEDDELPLLASYSVGIQTFEVSLQNSFVLNEEENSLGSFVNSSIEFSRADLFQKEKFFNSSGTVSLNSRDDIDYEKQFSENGIAKANLSRIRKPGDFSVDYEKGRIFIGTSYSQEAVLGSASYTYNLSKALNSNILYHSGTFKKPNAASSYEEYSKNYEDVVCSEEGISIFDLEQGMEIFDAETTISVSGNIENTCLVRSDYTAYTFNKIISLKSILLLDDLYSKNLSSNNPSERYEEASSQDLQTVADGGRNLFDSARVSFEENIIDFKCYAKRRAFASGGVYSFDILDGQATSVYKVIRNSNGAEITHSSLVTTVVDGNIHVEFSTLVPITPGEIIKVIYLTTSTPEVGSELAIDYNYGGIFYSYSYLSDEITVSYEYGDNTIEWISSSISEGERYYVSYRYGALRDALRQNFGTLTDVAIFRQFPLTFDREIYRNALKGMLQAFAKGPTIPSYTELVNNITKTNPEITESALSSWILGRDNIFHGDVYYKGDLKFAPGKFGDGLVFDDQTSVWIPSHSNLSLKEGSFSAWVSPHWDGVSNDAEIKFDFKNLAQVIGGEKISIKDSLLPGQNPFQKDWELVTFEEPAGYVDFKGDKIVLSNFKGLNDTDEIKVGKKCIYKKNDNLNALTSSKSSITFFIDMFGANYNNLPLAVSISSANLAAESDSKYNIFKFTTNDGTKILGLDFNLAAIKKSGLPVYFTPSSVEKDSLPDYTGPYPVSSCTCCYENNIEELELLNEKVLKINLATAINISFSDTQIIEDSCESLVLIDSEESVYQIVLLEDDLGQQFTTIPRTSNPLVKAFYVKRWPINKLYSKSLAWSEASDFLPIGGLNLFGKFLNVKVNGLALSSFHHFGSYYTPKLIDWSKENTYSFNKKVLPTPLGTLNSAEEVTHVEFNIYGNADFSTKILYFDLEDSSLFETLYDFSSFGSGTFLGNQDDRILVSATIKNIKNEYTPRFSNKDIWIGANGYHPSSSSFNISKNDYPNVSIGAPNNIDSDEGIFIWYDELATNVLSNKKGQWVTRISCEKSQSLVYSFFPFFSLNYTLTSFDFENKIYGTISTDGEFGSVSKASRNEGGQIQDGIPLEISYRFYGNHKIESDGWYRVEESDSLTINSGYSGRDAQRELWTKSGTFATSASSGVYRLGSSNSYLSDLLFSGNTIFTENKIPEGNIEFSTSLKVFSVDEDCATSEAGAFSSTVDGSFTGICPIHIGAENVNVKIALAFSEIGDSLICLIDGNNQSILDIIPFEWNDGDFHSYHCEISKQNEWVKLYVDSTLLSQRDFDQFSDSQNYFFAIHLMDAELVDSELFHSLYDSNIIDINLIEMNGNKYIENTNIEDDDIFLADQKTIEFEFNCNQTVSKDIDEIIFSSDKNKYLLDLGREEKSRISLFKDGKGFLNFKVIDDFGVAYNISYNAKDWNNNELHHIATSWKLNSFDKKDEMHLFVDGQEVPNIYKFGGTVPLKINAKFSDVSEETLQNYLVRSIDYSTEYEDGEVDSSLLFSSSSVYFDESFIGRSVIILPDSSAGYPSWMVGKELIISEVNSGKASFVTGSSLTPVTLEEFSSIKFKFPPTAGISDAILSDLRNNKFRIIRKDSSENTYELGGILYEVISGQIVIISGDEISNPAFRANIETRVIEFIGENDVCDFDSTIIASDIDIHIRTFGLTLERINKVLELPESSYSFLEGRSLLALPYSEPVSLDDVQITRIIQARTVISAETVDSENITENEISYDSLDTDKFLTSRTGEVLKSGLGRYLSIRFDSDNIDYSLYDGSEDVNYIIINGLTTDGVNFEKFVVTNNGVYNSSKIFLRISSIETKFKIIDPDYEVGTIEIWETNPVSVSDNGGDSCEVWDWQNGIFILSKVGTNGILPFELHSGFYRIDYPAYLRINISDIGNKIQIGADINETNAFRGVIDELRISNEALSDVRSTDIYNKNSLTVTQLFNKQHPLRTQVSDLALIHFDNPINDQARVLRRKEFLDARTNIKFKLTFDQQEALLQVVNNASDFISLMISFGFSPQISERTFFEVHKALGGPLFNEASFYNNNIEWMSSETSVNENFGKSAKFENVKGVRYANNDSFLRKGEGTIEFWVSPIVDTLRDPNARYFVDAFSSTRIRTKSLSNRLIELPSSAKEILSVKLVRKNSEDSIFYSAEEEIVFDNISRDDISGRLTQGTGVEKDFALGCTLSTDGTRIILAESLPGAEIDVVVSYIAKDSEGDRLSILKDKDGHIVFYIKASGVEHVVTRKISWRKNTWHRILCSWKTGTSHDTMRMFIDGVEAGFIRFGESLLFGIGAVFGTISTSDDVARTIEYNINFEDDLGFVTIGSDAFGYNCSNSRMDNIRFSRVMRTVSKDSTGEYFDFNFSQNTSVVYPVVKDDLTTKIVDFEPEYKKDSFATVIDRTRGIFDFDVKIFDGFEKIPDDDGIVEDLIVELINKLKPAHSNAYVKFLKS
jgi:hypothetical protein